MRLSIIVPVYNMASDGKLEYCIRSILNQTIEDYEIIAVDDASTDNSVEVLKQLQKGSDSRLIVVESEENHRQGGAKNIGLRMAKGDFVGFVDSDDWIAPTMYEKLLRKSEETGADVVACNYTMVYEHTMEPGKPHQNASSDQTGVLDVEHYRKLLLMPGSMVIKIYKRQPIIENQLFFPEHTLYEDNYMSPIWLLHFKHFEWIDESLYYYYQHSESTVHGISFERSHDRMRTMEMLVEKTKQMEVFDLYHPELEYKFAELYLKNTLFGYMQGKGSQKLKLARELRKGIKQEFPKFEENHYYQQRTNEEEKKLIHMLIKSPIYFYIYYNLLWTYRRMRKRK